MVLLITIRAGEVHISYQAKRKVTLKYWATFMSREGKTTYEFVI